MGILENFKDSKKFSIKWVTKLLGPFATICFLIAVLVMVASLLTNYNQKGEILGTADSTYNLLTAALKAAAGQDLTTAQNFFTKASDDFKSLESTIIDASNTLQPLVPSAISSTLHLTRAGQGVALAGKSFSQGLDLLLQTSEVFSQIQHFDSSKSQTTKNVQTSRDISQYFEQAYTQFTWAKDSLNLAADELRSVDLDSLSQNLKGPISQAQSQIKNVQSAANLLMSYSRLFGNLSSGDQRKYLLIFQNTSEARPTGGFIGTYGILKLKKGQVESLLIEGVYAVDNKITEKVEPPKPLQRITNSWAMRDSNWWPDFPTSAENIARFYQLETGEEVDGVISFTPKIFEEMIRIIGPINMPDYNLVVSENNFYDVVQFQTSKDGYYTNAGNKLENKPKKFISELSAEIFKQFPSLSANQKTTLVGVMLKAILEKDLLLYSAEPSVQELAEQLSITGKLSNPDEVLDYLLITNTNLGGGKTDRYTRQEVELTINISKDKQMENTLKIKRLNQSPSDLEISTNKNYLRVYVPKGSTLVSSNLETETFEELNRTVFASYIETPLGQESALELVYKLPDSKSGLYSLLLEKNPGQKMHKFDVRLNLPRNGKMLNVLGGNLQNAGLNTFGQTFENLTTNKFLGFIYQL